MKRLAVVIIAAAAAVGCTPNQPPTRPTTPSLAPRPSPGPTTQKSSPNNTLSTTRQSSPPSVPLGNITQTHVVPPIPQPHPPPHVLSRIGGITIPRDRVMQVVMETHGLNALLSVVQLELARQESTRLGLTVTSSDVQQEQQTTVIRMFPEPNQKFQDQIAEARQAGRLEDVKHLQEEMDKDNQSHLQQLLNQEHISPVEFALLMETNAAIRKIVEKQSAGKITEENIYEAFMMLYGENVRIRHIECANLQEITEAQRRLAAGQSFEKVARELSRNASTRELGGELRPFSREDASYPQAFKDVAFSLKTPGEVSDPVEANGAYHLIKLIERIAPKAVKFESVKESVRQLLYDRLITRQMKDLRIEMGKKALDSLQIEDPILAKQFKDRLAKRDNEIRERDQIARELALQRERDAARAIEAATRPTRPSTQPVTLPILPASSEVAQPPATRSGSLTPDQSK